MPSDRLDWHRGLLARLMARVRREKALPDPGEGGGPDEVTLAAWMARRAVAERLVGRLQDLDVALGKALSLIVVNRGRVVTRDDEVLVVSTALTWHVERLLFVGGRMLELAEAVYVDPLTISRRLSPWWDLRSGWTRRVLGTSPRGARTDAGYADPALLRYAEVQARVLSELMRAAVVDYLDEVILLLGRPLAVDGDDLLARLRRSPARLELGAPLGPEHLDGLSAAWLQALGGLSAEASGGARARAKAAKWTADGAGRLRERFVARQAALVRDLRSEVRAHARRASRLRARVDGLARRAHALLGQVRPQS
jgi:hypothetical protein